MECTVLTASKSSGISNGLTYEAPEGSVGIGSPVLVPLRKKMTEGIVLALNEKRENTFDVKAIKQALSANPLLPSFHIQTLRWMAEKYMCTLRQAIAIFLPSLSWKDLLPKEQKTYRLSGKKIEGIKGKKQRTVCDYLLGKDAVEASALREETGCSLATLRSLLEKGVLTEETSTKSSLPSSPANITWPTLTDVQQSVASSIAKEDRPSLLFGITSSGKTEVYAQMIAEAVTSGKSAILLVPEILLTEHCIHRFQALLSPERIQVVHSRLTPSARKAAWRACRAGEVDLVIGSRSALFSPLENLGLVVIDEEHEWTYKNEQTPRYHARETAEALCRFAGAKLLLGTATPSLESWQRAKGGVYHLVRLPDRYKGHALPAVRVVDLADVTFGKSYPFSPPLFEAIEQRLKMGEQSILFLNRRGLASALLCLECRRRVVSPDSQLPFTVHRGIDGRSRLIDHTTNLTVEAPKYCPHCGSASLREVGAGTVRIEDILLERFPQARILRADKDTLTHPEHMRLLLQKMRQGQADILLGTQSVVKGLDLPHVTLAAVLIADIGLSLPHFRAGERIFQLLTQLTGRSGRAQPGEVIIQTFRPQAPEVRLAAEHKTEEYLDTELKLRVHAGYPPATEMVRLLTRGTGAAHRAQAVATDARERARTHTGELHISCAPTLFGGGKVWHVLLRGNDSRSLLAHLSLEDMIVDIDPVECV
ncbi:primosomal protein N' [Candidatus Peregrinibacteria bacterium CG10_big_fil_rev_8_21_14_0_10_49_10]|nr:MAG: primosomal protein N' [Candidatus Peregrinibacteria bacterium CG10_big_fil_rev_8_21_14_0_10_49_10]